jgi:two-component system NtrC family sensor kinase
MENSRERILMVESDPDIGDLIALQTLQPIGYQIQIAPSASFALQEVKKFLPDIIMIDLDLPDLSGKDLQVALSAQGVQSPVIIISRVGMESELIQAFRLGASGYLIWPMREAEIVSVVERVLKQVRSRQESELLAHQLKLANSEFQHRVRELKTISAIGKALTSITNQNELLDKIVEGAVYITEAECGWLLLRESDTKIFNLVAEHNLPDTFDGKLNQPWDDGISSLVALSGETLSISGEPIMRVKLSQLGQSALVAPVKLHREVAGLIVVVRRTQKPFNPNQKNLLESIADYASISLANAQLFSLLEKRTHSMQQAAETAQINLQRKDELLINLIRDIQPVMENIIQSIELLHDGQITRLNSDQKSSINSMLEKLKETKHSFEIVGPLL